MFVNKCEPRRIERHGNRGEIRGSLTAFLLLKIGRGGEIRTPDPHNPIVVRYQAALRPDRCAGLRCVAHVIKAAMILAVLR